MAVIEGQIEPLKKLKAILHQNGITRFGSIGEINDFIKNYDREKSEIPKEVENELDEEISRLQIDLEKYQQHYEDLKNDVRAWFCGSSVRLEHASKWSVPFNSIIR